MAILAIKNISEHDTWTSSSSSSWHTVGLDGRAKLSQGYWKTFDETIYIQPATHVATWKIL